MTFLEEEHQRVSRASGVQSCMRAVSAPGEDGARGSRACLVQDQLQRFSEILVQKPQHGVEAVVSQNRPFVWIEAFMTPQS